MDINDLVIGEYYRELPNQHGIKVTSRPVQYCGQELYQGEARYAFWDRKMRLSHWLNPERVESILEPLGSDTHV